MVVEGWCKSGAFAWLSGCAVEFRPGAHRGASSPWQEAMGGARGRAGGRPPGPAPATGPGAGGRGLPVADGEENSRTVTKTGEAGDRVTPSHAHPAEGPHMTYFPALLNVVAATSSKKSGSPAFLIILVVI